MTDGWPEWPVRNVAEAMTLARRAPDRRARTSALARMPGGRWCRRVVDVVDAAAQNNGFRVFARGLDTQADGGTHVASTRQVGRIRVAKVENKGRGFRRLRIKIED